MKQKLQSRTSQNRKEDIIMGAAKVFASKGFHAATSDVIAAEIGISKPTLYRYVHSKAEILKEVTNIVMGSIEELIKVGSTNLPPEERIKNVIKLLVKITIERQIITVIAFEQTNLLPKKHRKALRKRHKEFERVVQNILRQGQREDVFNINDIKMASFIILGAVNWMYRWYKPGGDMNAEQLANEFILFLENGYLKKSNGN